MGKGFHVLIRMNFGEPLTSYVESPPQTVH